MVAVYPTSGGGAPCPLTRAYLLPSLHSRANTWRHWHDNLRTPELSNTGKEMTNVQGRQSPRALLQGYCTCASRGKARLTRTRVLKPRSSRVSAFRFTVSCLTCQARAACSKKHGTAALLFFPLPLGSCAASMPLGGARACHTPLLVDPCSLLSFLCGFSPMAFVTHLCVPSSLRVCVCVCFLVCVCTSSSALPLWVVSFYGCESMLM